MYGLWHSVVSFWAARQIWWVIFGLGRVHELLLRSKKQPMMMVILLPARFDLTLL